MKRALAERVKQERGEPIVPPNAPPSSLPMGYTGINGVSTGGAPPSKIPRTNMSITNPSSLSMAPLSASSRGIPQSVMGGMEIHSMSAASPTSGAASSKKRPRSSPPNASSSGNAAAYQSQKLGDDDHSAAASTPKGRGPGRPRKPASKQLDSSDEDEADTTSFYLKHQNVALASELYAYRRRIYLLEREREFRRKECRLAEHKIGELGGVWKGLESAIGKELESNALLKKVSFPVAMSPSSLSTFFLTMCVLNLLLIYRFRFLKYHIYVVRAN